MGNNKMANIAPEMINDCLMENVTKELSEQKEIYLIHDPSDIRKPYSKDADYLGQVRDLRGKIINGYSTHNVVAVTPNDQSVRLLSHSSYSNKEPTFLKQEFIEKLNSGKQFEGETQARRLYESGDYFNKKTLTVKEIKRVSREIKGAIPGIKITHILDREFDDIKIFDLINNELDDKFVIRIKKNRTIDSKDKYVKRIKLIESEFKNSYEVSIKKIQFKDKVRQDVKLSINWNDYGNYKLIKVIITDRNGKNIFQAPMLILSNKEIGCGKDAYDIYLSYLKRAKIEYVFRFLKDGLGWEDMQIRDFKGIQNLLSICFYVSAYLYEIGDEVAYDDFSILLAKIGGGKGKVTRHYILKGIQMLLAKHRVDRVFEKFKVSTETQQGLNSFVGVDLSVE
jgi:hypothetical protein